MPSNCTNTSAGVTYGAKLADKLRRAVRRSP